MLDENLPTFRLRQSPDTPSTSILVLTQNGSDPTPEYIFRRADPAVHPAARNKYAAALCSATSAADIIYGEVMVEPTWSQPSLSAAELRSTGGVAPPPVPLTPDHFDLLLYNPDQTISVTMEISAWTKSESWEFEMPTQSFREPTSSQLDREQRERAESLGALGVGTPRVVFKWKRDGRLSKDMTCYLVGMNLGGKKSKEPDITIAMCKAGKDAAVTIYEPNLRRVEVEDRKGLEVVLLLSAEVIRDLYLAPRGDVFNTGLGDGSSSSSRRKNSRPTPPPHSSSGGNGRRTSGPIANANPNTHITASMSGALGTVGSGSSHSPAPVHPSPSYPNPAAPHHHTQPNNQSSIDAETRRLQAMVQREEAERRAARESEEQDRIKAMLEEEDRQREAAIAQETERLKKLYGVQGQELPGQQPPLPPRTQHVQFSNLGAHPSSHGSPNISRNGSYSNLNPMVRGNLSRNSSYTNLQGAAPAGNPFHGASPNVAPRPLSRPPSPHELGPSNGFRRSGEFTRSGRSSGRSSRRTSVDAGQQKHGLGLLNPGASLSNFFGGQKETPEEKEKRKAAGKKKSGMFDL